ncbi:MAG: hypothetical protein O2795_14540 [Acidobacteria bacterium]|nr:hypothetical protein [Acidobacteriota bacterium]
MLVEIIDAKEGVRQDAVLTNRGGKFSFGTKYREAGPWLLRFSLPGYMAVEQEYLIDPQRGHALVMRLPLGI